MAKQASFKTHNKSITQVTVELNNSEPFRVRALTGGQFLDLMSSWYERNSQSGLLIDDPIDVEAIEAEQADEPRKPRRMLIVELMLREFIDPADHLRLRDEIDNTDDPIGIETMDQAMQWIMTEVGGIPFDKLAAGGSNAVPANTRSTPGLFSQATPTDATN